jgi:flagellar biosynthesis protein FliR
MWLSISLEEKTHPLQVFDSKAFAESLTELLGELFQHRLAIGRPLLALLLLLHNHPAYPEIGVH